MKNVIDNSNLKTIILDCAHGINVAGKQSPCGLFKEYEWSRYIQYRIAELLKVKEIPFVLVPEKNNDREIGLLNRVQRFNKIDNAFVFSLHSNAHGNGNNWTNARGVENFNYLNSKLSKPYNEKIYNAVKDNFPNINGSFNYNTFWRGVKEAKFTVLTSKHPSVLFEWLFMTNKDDLALLQDEKTNHYLAECLANQLELISLGVDKIESRVKKEKRI